MGITELGCSASLHHKEIWWQLKATTSALNTIFCKQACLFLETHYLHLCKTGTPYRADKPSEADHRSSSSQRWQSGVSCRMSGQCWAWWIRRVGILLTSSVNQAPWHYRKERIQRAWNAISEVSSMFQTPDESLWFNFRTGKQLRRVDSGALVSCRRISFIINEKFVAAIYWIATSSRWRHFDARAVLTLVAEGCLSLCHLFWSSLTFEPRYVLFVKTVENSEEPYDLLGQREERNKVIQVPGLQV